MDRNEKKKKRLRFRQKFFLSSIKSCESVGNAKQTIFYFWPCEAKKKINKQQSPESPTHFESPWPHLELLDQLHEALRNRPRSTNQGTSGEVPTHDHEGVNLLYIWQGKGTSSTKKQNKRKPEDQGSPDYWQGITTTMKNKKYCCESLVKISAVARQLKSTTY